MEKEEIESIARWACQPRRYVWRKWLDLLLPLGVPREELLTYKPEMVEICEPLLDRRKKINAPRMDIDPEDEYLPAMCAIYKEALEIIEAFQSWKDLATLAIYRRQVHNLYGIESIDSHFYRLVRDAKPQFDSVWLIDVAKRMQPGGSIHQQLLSLARQRKLKVTLPSLHTAEEEAPLLAAD